MVEYTLLEKIRTVFNLVTNSPLFLILLFGILLMIIDILFISKKDKKTKKIYAIVSVIIVILFMNSYLESITSILDTIAKNIVAMIYFPTILQYIIMLLVSLIILAISIFSKKINNIVRRVNIFVLVINGFLFFLILDQISGSNVDLSNKISIYSSTLLMILLELSIFIFIVWITGLILYKIIKKLSHDKNEEVTFNTPSFYESPVLPHSFEELQRPLPEVEYIVIEKEVNNKEIFTLEEYKKMKELLEIMTSVTKKDV